MIQECKIDTGDAGIVLHGDKLINNIVDIFDEPHAFLFVRHLSKLYVYEMASQGLVRTLHKDSYLNKSGWVLMKPNKEYTDSEKMKGERFAEHVYSIHPNYDAVSLIRFLTFKVEGRYPLEKNDNGKLTCGEWFALWTNYLRPYTFRIPETVSPEHIYKHKLFKLIS